MVLGSFLTHTLHPVYQNTQLYRESIFRIWPGLTPSMQPPGQEGLTLPLRHYTGLQNYPVSLPVLPTELPTLHPRTHSQPTTQHDPFKMNQIISLL